MMIDHLKLMTPAEMRKRAWRSLGTADVVINHGDADTAAYLAGQAAELALKARYCAKEGLPNLPTDRKELQRHKLNEHRLQELLKLSDSESVQRGALDLIDWPRVSEWHNEDRYKPVGHVSLEQATVRVAQTKRLFHALVDYEIVEALAKVESLLAGEGVVFNLFAWLRGEDGKWKLTIASKWFDEPTTREERVARVHQEMAQVLAPDLYKQVTSIDYDGVLDDVPRAFYGALSVAGGSMTVRGATIFSGGHLPLPVRNAKVFALDHIRTDYGGIPRAYVIAVQPPAV